MKVFKVLMVWIVMVMPLAVNVLQSKGQIPEKSVTEKLTKLLPSLEKYEPIPETSESPNLLSTESGKS